MNVAELLHRQAAARPNAPALISGRGRHTRIVGFWELDDASARVAALLRNRGLGKGDVALLLQPVSIELYVVLFALCRLGATAMFLDPSAGREHIEACCAALPPKALIASAKGHLLRALSAALRGVPIKLSTAGWVPGAHDMGRAGDSAPRRRIEPCRDEDPALVTFTSGSTGAPKGVVRSHGLLAAQHQALARAMRPRDDRIDLITLPVFVLSSLAEGVPCVLPDADLRAPGAVNPAPLLGQIVEHRVTRIIASPALCERLLARGDGCRPAFARLAEIFTGGGPVFPDLLRRLAAVAPQAAVTAVYGSTEAEPIAHLGRTEISDLDLAATAVGRGLPAGSVVPELRLAILPDRFGEPIGPFTPGGFAASRLPAGETGEIAVSGRHVVGGYLDARHDGQTKFTVGNETWHRTGDAGHLDATARLWLMGRCDARIVDGHGILYPLALEAAARARLGPCRVACVSVSGERTLLVEGSERHIDPEGLRADLRWARLGSVRFVEKIPVDRRHNSKIDYPGLRRMLEGAHRRPRHMAPGADPEGALSY